MSIEKFTLGELCTIEKGTTGILKAIPGEYPLVVTGEERKSHNEFQFDDNAVIIPIVSGTGAWPCKYKKNTLPNRKICIRVNSMRCYTKR